MTQLRRKHLSAGTYFIWRCKHKDGMQDRVSDNNDGPNQAECEVELIEKPDYAHIRTVARVELGEVMSRLDTFREEIAVQLGRIVGELSLPHETRSCRLCNGEPFVEWADKDKPRTTGATHHTCHPGEERATLLAVQHRNASDDSFYSVTLRHRVSTSDLFHCLWTKAVGASDYVKAEWMELERRLIDLKGIEKVYARQEPGQPPG